MTVSRARAAIGCAFALLAASGPVRSEDTPAPSTPLPTPPVPSPVAPAPTPPAPNVPSPAAPTSGAPAPSVPAGAGIDLEAGLERGAPVIVSLQILLKVDDAEETTWAHGVVVDPSGLVMLSASETGGGDMKLADVNVLVGNDPKEWPAVLVARDKTLDLAYVQMLGLDGKTLAAVDFRAAREARKTDVRLGEPLYGVTRMGRGFDYAPSVRRLYFTCRVESPRRMWDFTGEFGEAGLPAFDMAGNAVAVLANQASAEGATEGGGTRSDVFALPLDLVLRSLEAVKKKIPDAVKKAEGGKKDADAGKDADSGKGAGAGKNAGGGDKKDPDGPGDKK